MEIILVLITSISISIANIICFFLGAKIGQKVINNEPIKMEIKSPIQKIKEHENKKEIEKQQEIEEIILHNIDVYDGTSLGQKDIPR